MPFSGVQYITLIRKGKDSQEAYGNNNVFNSIADVFNILKHNNDLYIYQITIDSQFNEFEMDGALNLYVIMAKPPLCRLTGEVISCSLTKTKNKNTT